MVNANAHVLAVAATALLAALPVQAGLYSKSSHVVQINEKNYDRLIAQSNYTSIVEFYAPWCGHCKNLQPAYEKAAKSLEGLAKVAAVDCDDESNKPFCGGFGVTGFPTLKIVKPGKTPGKPIVEDYNGPRTAKGIADAVADKIVNHVKRVDDKTLEAWLAESNETAKAILFTDKGKTSALLKSVAIEFKGSISVAQIRNTDKEKASLELFGITKFPTLLLLPGGKEAEGIIYDGELKKAGIVDFLSKQTNISPNPDPAPAKVKLPKSKSSTPKKPAKSAASSKSTPSETTEPGPSATDETLVDDQATPSPDPIVEAEKPILLPPAPPIPILSSTPELGATHCLGSKSGTCVFALLSSTPDAAAAKAVGSLSEISHRHRGAKRVLFPFYALPESNPSHETIKTALGLKGTEIIAINGKRGWWRKLPSKGDAYTEDEVTETAIENWVDGIRLGEGAKMKVPEGLIDEEAPEPTPEATPEAQMPEGLKFEFLDEDGKPMEGAGPGIKIEEVHDEL